MSKRRQQQWVRYSERADVDVIASVISEGDDVTLISGQVRVYTGEKVITTFKLQSEADGRADQLVETVVSLGRVEPQTAVARLTVTRPVLALWQCRNNNNSNNSNNNNNNNNSIGPSGTYCKLGDTAMKSVTGTAQ